jgi:glycosyltransferase involved in cell wall biosynthesis
MRGISMDGEKIKVAFFSEVLKENLDGVTHTVHNLIKRVPEKKFEFLFITPVPPTCEFKHPVIVIPGIRIPANPDYKFALPFFNKTLKKELERFKPDLIHLTTPFTLGVYALNYGKKHNIPVVTTYHTHFISYIEYYFSFLPPLIMILRFLGWKYFSWFYSKCTKVFIPTTSIAQELADNNIPENIMQIWGRGVDTTLFNPMKKDDEFMDKLCGKNVKKVLFVSRIVWEKELKTLYRVYKRLLKKRPDIKMIVTGDGPQRQTLEKLMPEAVFTGKLLKNDLAKVYASSDVFIFPSITETFGNVVLEASASGIPAVIASKGGPKGIIINGVTGFHTVPKNDEDMYNKIIDILDNKTLHERMSIESVKYASSQKWSELCSKMFQSYETIVNSYSNERLNYIEKPDTY